MNSNIKNLPNSKEKLVYYAVIQVSVSKTKDNDILYIDNIFCDKHHIFINESLADKFCDHANKSEKLSYQWLEQEIVLDK